MKSRITIDLDTDNQPIIQIEYQPSEDVRDKMVKRFLETIGSNSTCSFRYESDLAIIRPNLIDSFAQSGVTITYGDSVTTGLKSF